MKIGLIHFEYFDIIQLSIEPLKKKKNNNKRSKNIITIFCIKLMFNNYIMYSLLGFYFKFYFNTLINFKYIYLIINIPKLNT